MVYTESQLRREARLAVKSKAKACGVKAKFTGFDLHLADRGQGACVEPSIIAYGQYENGVDFKVYVAI